MSEYKEENHYKVISKKQMHCTTMHSRFHGNEFWLDTIFVPIITVNWKIVQVIGLSRDITIKVLLEKEMKKRNIGVRTKYGAI